MEYRIITASENSYEMDGDARAQGEDIVRFEIEGVMTCRACGTVGYAGERYCSRCGASFAPGSRGNVSAVRRCPGCGEPLRHPIAFFCACCGVALGGEDCG